MAIGPTDEDLKKVEKDLGYEFRDKWLLRQLHYNSSQVSKRGLVRDAAMHLVVSDLVYDSLPKASTDILTDRRTTLVMRDFCAEGARKLGWNKIAFTGKSFPKQEEQAAKNMLAELFEAVWGALYKDSGGNIHAVMDAYSRHFALHEVTTNGTASFHAMQQGASAAEGSAKAQEVAAALADLTFK
ncbi:ribonuclease III [Coccomyxa subellipsoidea C-169]|uniref:Ribonuclease III n=1 Tax=Coccomyxa subellipsoidea (strain C-169) TaxID=574566 RepID=I0YNA7_COCSC|nr:ribonuclease III [Coccomyxa subellipsoidea C-169]EIE19876.1 ribonuclease III [Coccomyxa subellipsoidea C-169]|eukprot:XP_005644420.1 ribonuclease III [Coccomyxa subellipsoidea C-169]